MISIFFTNKFLKRSSTPEKASREMWIHVKFVNTLIYLISKNHQNQPFFTRFISILTLKNIEQKSKFAYRVKSALSIHFRDTTIFFKIKVNFKRMNHFFMKFFVQLTVQQLCAFFQFIQNIWLKVWRCSKKRTYCHHLAVWPDIRYNF